MGPALSAAKGELKPLGHAQGAWGACSTQGCSQALAERLGDGSVVLDPSAHLMGALSTQQTSAGSVLHFPAFTKCWFKYNSFPPPALTPSQRQEKLRMAPFSPGRAAAGTLLLLVFLFHVAAFFPGELPINYAHGKWAQKAAGINN